MIASFRHRGLKALYEGRTVRRVAREHVGRLRDILAALDFSRGPGVNPRGWTVGVGWIDRLRVSGCIHTLEFLRRPVAEGGVQASSIVYLLKEVGESVG